MADAQPLTIMVPLGGVGARFQREGYASPKPFVTALGKPMILWVLDSLVLSPADELVIVYNPEFIPTKFWGVVTASYPRLRLVELPGATRGAAETVMIGLRGLPRDVRSRPVMLVDGDTFYGEDIVSKYRAHCATSHGVFYFVDTQPKPIYSYITFEPSSSLITQVKEKVKISDHANSGCYCFMSGTELEAECQALLDAGSMQLSQDAIGEYYTSGVIAQMIEAGGPFRAIEIQPSQYHVLGTPSQLQAFCRSWKEQPALRICFDLDNTLVTVPEVAGDYSTCGPVRENIAVCRALHAQGHTIIIATSRRMRTHEGNAAATVADIGEVTMRTLRELRIPYHELAFGKPYAHYYVDDLAVSAFRDLHKELGFYPASPTCTQPTAAAPRRGPPPTATLAAPPAEHAPPPPRPLLQLLLATGLGAGIGMIVGMRMRK